MLVLPYGSRKLFKDPFGTLYRSLDTVLPKIEGHVVYTVGDVVTHSLQQAGITPSVAVIDGQTMRSPCSNMPIISGKCIRVKNPPGSITDDLVNALAQAVNNPPATILVEGEEDLAVIPLVIAAPKSSIVLYGQPNKGIVLRIIDDAAKSRAKELLGKFIRSDSANQ